MLERVSPKPIARKIGGSRIKTANLKRRGGEFLN